MNRARRLARSGGGPTRGRGALAVALAALAGACGPSETGYDSGLEGLALVSVGPKTVVPGSVLEITGRSFVSGRWGEVTLRLAGTVETGDGRTLDIDARHPAQFIDFEHLEVEVDDPVLASFGAPEADFEGEVWVEVDSVVDGNVHETNRIPITLSVRETLAPELASVQSGGLVFANDPIAVDGGGLLFGGGEGQTVAVLSGCFRKRGETACEAIEPARVPVKPEEGDRSRGAFAFAPAIAGIEPGVFEGEVTLENEHAGGDVTASSTRSVSYELTEPAIFEVSPDSASLGQYVFIEGGGFVGGEPGHATLLELTGTFTPEGEESSIPVDLLLVPEFVEGRKVRYVLNEDDSLGNAIDLRQQTGRFEGEIRPVTSVGNVEVTGSAQPVSLAVAPVKQVVYVRFTTPYVESLRRFGLRGVDGAVRDRALDVLRRDYDTINLEVRTEPPEDFALYAQVNIGGPDPNDLGLLGYDNTPGKDVDNERLYDRIGGVNAQTQEDGYPGYGGVFIESLLLFSPSQGTSVSDPDFDAIFDPFRPDRGGEPVRASDLAQGIPALESGASCPAEGRRDRIGCAIWVLGSLIGTTISHEIGHSLGLANPYGNGFHNPGNEPNRLMDSGESRPFAERAEIRGQGPSRFCTAEYEYLRAILPSGEPADTGPRPSCN